MDILRQDMAPISDQAWAEINDQAKAVLENELTARRFVDMDGPKGWNYGAVQLGRIEVPDNQTPGEVNYGLHQVQPLVETRIPFTLNVWELDNITRGAKDADLDALEQAARKIAAFEERAVYHGFAAAGVQGLGESSAFDPIPFPDDVEQILAAVITGVNRMREASVNGPYTLVLPPDQWRALSSLHHGFPLEEQLRNLIGGKILPCTNVDNAFLVSERGGDFILTVGQDLSIGFNQADSKMVQLFFTESFTFRVIEPAAVVVFQ
jgi:uncharacterized linocin/CFP29 family protein